MVENDENAFGFSFVDEEVDDIEGMKTDLQTKETAVQDLQARLDKLYDKIDIFLTNLSKNPEKTTIKWPNRAEKINSFREELKNIKEGVSDDKG